ncbi:hypothetical protein ACHAPT_004578 [Fusarium lateritium]
MENHLLMSCEEAAREEAGDLRHKVEEAMSKALIHKCNKCGVPFIKERGYGHFTTGSKCVLFGDVEDRHQEEIEKAGKAAADALLANNPNLRPEQLSLTMSRNVEEDDQRWKQDDPLINQDQLYIDGVRVNGRDQAGRGMARRRGQRQAHRQAAHHFHRRQPAQNVGAIPQHQQQQQPAHHGVVQGGPNGFRFQHPAQNWGVIPQQQQQQRIQHNAAQRLQQAGRGQVQQGVVQAQGQNMAGQRENHNPAGQNENQFGAWFGMGRGPQ